MEIEKSWFYKLEDSKDNILYIQDGLNVCLYDTTQTLNNIYIGNNVKFHYFSYFANAESVKKHFHIQGQKSDVMIRSFCYSLQNTLKVSMTWELQNSFSKLDMNIVSIVGESWDIELDGIVQINENIAQVEWYLREQNIFLWNTGKIRWIPTLLVRSNDVKASHGCNIEKMSDEKLFYLRSRGLEKSHATRVMIESYIRNAFGYLEHVDTDFYHHLVDTVSSNIK